MTGFPPIRRAVAGIGRLDVAAAIGVAAIGQQGVWAPGLSWSHTAGPAPMLALAYVIAAAALLWRRRAPLGVVSVVTVVLSGEYVLSGGGHGLGGFLPPLLALYAAGRYGDGRRLAAAVAITAAGLAIHDMRDPQFSLAGPSAMFWVVVLSSGFVGRAFSANARNLEQVSRRAWRLAQEREERARAAVGAERARIARELHDLVGHGISLMVLQLVAAEANLDAGQVGPARERLTRLETTARSTLAEMRRLVSVIDDEEPSLSPQPGVAEIGALVEQVRSSGVPVDLEITGPAETPAGIGLAVYRLVQEALTNIIKHARPSAGARVVVAAARDAIVVEVTDCGEGPVGDLSGGRGLAGIKERVTLYGGTLQIGPRPEGGFRVRASFPLDGAVA